jgi:MFS family permease
LFSQETLQSTDKKPKYFYGYIVVVSAFFIMMTILGLHGSFGVFFKPVLTEFGWTRAMTSGAFSIAVIIQGLLGVFMGGLNDKLGPRVVLSLCGLLFALGYLLMSQINSVWQLYLFYGLIIGSGISGVWVPLMSTVARWFTDRRGLMSGIVLAGLSIGGLSIPPIATKLISTYDWRTSYIILGSIALVVVISAAQFLKRDPAQIGRNPYTNSKRPELQSALSTDSFTFKEAVRTAQLWILIFLLFCSGFCMFGVIVHIIPHATDLGLSPAIASSILAALNAVSIAGRVGLGGAADKIGNKQVFIISFLLMSGALLSLMAASEAWHLYLFALVFGFAYGGLGVAESPLVAELFGLTSHGLIYAVILLGWTTGASFGPFLTGYIFDVTKSYQMAFLVTAAAGILGLIFTVVLKPTKKAEAQRV